MKIVEELQNAASLSARSFVGGLLSWGFRAPIRHFFTEACGANSPPQNPREALLHGDTLIDNNGLSQISPPQAGVGWGDSGQGLELVGKRRLLSQSPACSPLPTPLSRAARVKAPTHAEFQMNSEYTFFSVSMPPDISETYLCRKRFFFFFFAFVLFWSCLQHKGVAEARIKPTPQL